HAGYLCYPVRSVVSSAAAFIVVVTVWGWRWLGRRFAGGGLGGRRWGIRWRWRIWRIRRRQLRWWRRERGLVASASEGIMVPQNKITETKVPEKKIDEFVSRLRAAAGPNLQSVILYGSAVSGEFDPEFSDINLLCILRGTSFPMLEAVAPAVEWWNKQKQPAPLFMTREELERSADVFSMESIDIKAQHRMLF